MNKKHIYTEEQKRQWWDEGEWCYEPDVVEFEHQSIKCLVKRVVAEEPCANEEHMFGGYLCGYVCIPQNHPYYHKPYEDLDIDCHKGLTFGEYGEYTNEHWIGFDCAHSGDYLPSTEKLKKRFAFENPFPMEKEFKEFSIFNPVYRNMEYCIDQCKSIAEQLVKEKNEK